MSHPMRFSFGGKTYQVGPEMWADVSLPRDHSWWARSVRWSCGRPGYTTSQLRFDAEQSYRRTLAAEVAYAFTVAQILSADGDGFIKVSGV